MSIKPQVHCKAWRWSGFGVGTSSAASKQWAPNCNKTRFNDQQAPCRKRACLVDGFSQLDKLKVSLQHHKRQLEGMMLCYVCHQHKSKDDGNWFPNDRWACKGCRTAPQESKPDFSMLSKLLDF